MASDTSPGVLRDAHYPRRAPVDAYGNGGFRFADMSHRGSILCLPSGIYGWTGTAEAPFSGERLLKVFEEMEGIRFLLFGTGPDIRRIPPALADRLKKAGISCDPMSTGAAVRTYNIMLSEGRPVAAALVAVD
ncbi:Mth938-like domain-containing protein [Aureimonas pseudogalii]|uniref:NADH dehydrogenase [ubiquinone] 1 alpha subcomplex assembly factor 3 n=1 Tax=Aureimonas pseudogalii TaxID=1744844 RepID=A0A7W6EH36_9HYPH|nr:MTH938/NDUFAF3 family protein [Aureimonas pseudogalii]MBB3998293.1 uncharacterized protein [Aureimonas pseudogalii]